MKRLYAVLVILIILGANNLNLTGSDANVANDTGTVELGDSGFPKLDNFTDTKVNDTAMNYVDSNNMTISVNKIDNGQDISSIAGNTYNSGGFTSNQTIDQNGVTTYFLYREGVDSYDSDIYFNINNQNYLISGNGISYENSDYFINHCKSIIDALNNNNNDSGKLSRW